MRSFRRITIPVGLARPLLLALLVLGAAAASFADIYGRLQFTIKSAADETPIFGATISLHDSAGVHPDITLLTDKDGMALSQPLEIRPWGVTVSATLFEPVSRQVQVVAGANTPVEALLEPLNETVLIITGTATKPLVLPTETQDVTIRPEAFTQTFPLSPANPQSLQALLVTAPGMVEDSVGQIHARGEHSGNAISLDGFVLPGANQGHYGQIIVPSDIQTADIITGNYAPEYGGETAAVLNLNLRAGTIVPSADLTLGYGSFDTFNGDLTMSGQTGSRIDPSSDARRLGYFFDISDHATDNAVDPPQPKPQDAHNRESDLNVFGKFDYLPDASDKLSLTLNTDPANSQIANRTGLSGDLGGYGFGGLFLSNGQLSAPTVCILDASGITPAPFTATPLTSQQADGQDINQRDLNQFAILNWQHTLNPTTTSNVSVGYTRSDLNVTNNNPGIDLANLPYNNSIEYNPSYSRDSSHAQAQGSVTSIYGTHTLKAGGVFDDQSGDESYQFIPGNQLALDALYAVDPRLAPAGSLTGGTDVLGNPIYTITPGATSPTLLVNRSGYYAAAYAQDTWDISRKFTANYGLRFDAYDQKEDVNIGNGSTVDTSSISPRVNLAYQLAKGLVSQVSYNRLFSEPPLAQGSFLGAPIQPCVADQYEVDLEKQLSSRQVVKAAYYIKNEKNQIDVGILIPYTQIGAYTADNFDEGHVKGLELSYDLLPKRDNTGWSAYLAYTNSVAKPTGYTNTGDPVPAYNDHDQLNTLSTGVAYNWRSGITASTDVYYGSGTATSTVFANGPRSCNMQVNVAISTRPILFHRMSFALSVQNLFNDLAVINFDSGFSGTRFEQGRTIILSTKIHLY